MRIMRAVSVSESLHVKMQARLFFDWEKREGVLPPELCDEHKHEEGTPMLLEQATVTNVSRAIRETSAFEWRRKKEKKGVKSFVERLSPQFYSLHP